MFGANFTQSHDILLTASASFHSVKYSGLMYELYSVLPFPLMMDICKGEQDIAAGRVHSTDDVRRAIASDLGVSI